MTKDEEIIRLKSRVAALEKDNQLLKEELSFLKTFPTLAQGLKGEVLVAQLTGGTVTGYAVRHDVEVKTGERLEVKYSQVNVQSETKTGRWNWYNLLGRGDKGKEYDYLVLIGEKDPRYDAQYPIDLPYVFFLVPRRDVGQIKSSSKMSVGMNTNLKTAKAPQSQALKRHLVVSGAAFKDLLANVAAP